MESLVISNSENKYFPIINIAFFREKNTYYYVHKLFGRMDRNNINISLSLTLHFFREKTTYYYVHKLFGRRDRNNINVFCFFVYN